MASIEKHGSVYLIRPHGPLRSDTVRSLDELVHGKLTGGVPAIVVDFCDTPLMDSAGLQWLLELGEECCHRGGCLRICNVGELCSDLLRITGVGDSIEGFTDLTTALGSFA